MKIALPALLATVLASLAIAPAASASPGLLIPAPSFYYTCDGAGAGAYVLWNDGRVYDCGRQGFIVN